MNTFSISEAVGFGWKTVKGRFWFLAGLVVITMVVGNLGQILGGIFRVDDGFGMAILMIASVVLQSVIQLGVIRIILNLVDGKPVEYKDLLVESNKLWTYLAASVLVMLCVLAGFIALIIPGVILAIMLAFYSYVLVDKNVGIVESLKMSARITKGNRWSLLGLALVCAVINILGMLCLGVGLLISIPVTMLAQAYVYRKLASGHEVIVAPPTSLQAVMPVQDASSS